MLLRLLLTLAASLVAVRDEMMERADGFALQLAGQN